MRGTKLGGGAGDLVKTEVDHRIRLPDHFGQVVADIDPGDDFDVWIGLAAAEQRLAHPAVGSVDDYLGHGCYLLSTPQALSVRANWTRLALDILQSGRRYCSSHLPNMERAALAGTGLVSMNRSLNIG